MISTKKTKLNVLQLRDLHLELNGDTALATKGLLQEKIPFVLKLLWKFIAQQKICGLNLLSNMV
jgi:hypothetical protein